MLCKCYTAKLLSYLQLSFLLCFHPWDHVCLSTLAKRNTMYLALFNVGKHYCYGYNCILLHILKVLKIVLSWWQQLLQSANLLWGDIAKSFITFTFQSFDMDCLHKIFINIICNTISVDSLSVIISVTEVHCWIEIDLNWK